MEEHPKAIPDFYGKISNYNGYRRHDLLLGENPVIIVEPANPAPGRRWIWRAEFSTLSPGSIWQCWKEAGGLRLLTSATLSAARLP